ncbi:unnamed protein product [Heligmosomoides polygyrus]|uniref:DDE_Tnp_1_7 domain-containing protein n=1 Tax=Heligmosomoides polygyrus TaxID=6339 RepID=A0A183G8F5_HELPZ|nr:unnamed protein product [Heligmosomoides polygyrus]
MQQNDDLDNSFERLLLISDSEDDGNGSGSDQSCSPLVEADTEDGGSDDSDSGDNDDPDDEWKEVRVGRGHFIFENDDAGPHEDVLTCKTPTDFYELFMKDIWELVVRETNRYGADKNSNWLDTDIPEMKRFIGLCLKMGQVRLPLLRDYWSTSRELTETAEAAPVMTRARFETLLRNLHLADNSNYDAQARLYKISPLLKLFNAASGSLFRPGRRVCIEESLVPFRGRLLFRQYIPSKRHRYGIKVFKLCSEGGYTCKIRVYAGKDCTRTGTVAETVVVGLMEEYLDQARDLFVDNWYTGISLAQMLIKRSTNLVGRKGLPLDVVQTKLKRGQRIARQNADGIVVMTWKDKRDIIMLSTIHDDGIGSSSKPHMVEDYNNAKLFVDTSDQMASYSPFVRKTSKWYIRLFFHIVTQTIMVNAWKLYQDNVGKMRFNDCKRKIFVSLLSQDNATGPCDRPAYEDPCHITWLTTLKKFRDSATASVRADAHSQSPASVESMRGSLMRGRHRGATELVRKSRNVSRTRVATLNVGTLTGRSCELVEALERRRVDFCAVQETRWSCCKSRDIGRGFMAVCAAVPGPPVVLI